MLNHLSTLNMVRVKIISNLLFYGLMFVSYSQLNAQLCPITADLVIEGGAYHCQGEAIKVLNRSQIGNKRVKVVWDWGDKTEKEIVFDTLPRTHVYAGDTSGCTPSTVSIRSNYTLSLFVYDIVDTLNCWHSQTSPIFIYKKPEASFRIPSSICLDKANAVQFTNTSCPNSPQNYTFLWEVFNIQTGKTDTITSYNPIWSFKYAGDYLVTLSMTSLQGGVCGTSKALQKVVIRDIPIAAAVFNQTAECGPFDITFNNQSVGVVTNTWSVTPAIGWSFQNGTNAHSVNPVIRFSERGTYTVKLLITNPCGNKEWTSAPIVVKTIPNVSIDSIPPICIPASITPRILNENNGGVAISEYKWEFEGGTPATSTGKTPPSILYDKIGIYKVTLSAKNTCGMSVAPPRWVVINEVIIESINHTPILPKNCAPYDFKIDNQSQYETSRKWTITPNIGWEFVNNSKDTTKSPSLQFTKEGTYNISFVQSNNCGSKTWNKTINIISKPTFALDSVAPACLPATITPRFTTSNDGGDAITEYKWEFEGGTPATSASSTPPTIKYESVGKFPIRLSVTNGCGTVTSSTRWVVVNAQVVENITHNLIDSVNCAPFELKFNNQSLYETANNWTITPSIGWEFASGTATSKSPKIRFLNKGTYTIKLVMQSDCTPKIWSKTINIYTAPIVTLDTILAACPPTFITPKYTVDSGGLPLSVFHWESVGAAPSSSDGNNPGTFKYEISGMYVLKVSLTNACSSIVANRIVTVNPVAKIAVTKTGTPANNCGPFDVNFNNTSTGSPDFLWTITPQTGWRFKNNTTNKSQSPGIEFFEVGNYFIKMEMPSACGNGVWQDTIPVFFAPSIKMNPIVLNGECRPQKLNISANVINSGGLPLNIRWSHTSDTSLILPPQILDTVGIFTFTIRANNICNSSIDSQKITIKERAKIQIQRPTRSPICNTEPPFTVQVTPTGGKWKGLGISENGLFTPTGLVSGNYLVTYSYGAGDCIVEDTLTIKIFGTPVKAGADTTVCGLASVPFILRGATPALGIWKGNGILDSIKGIFSPTVAGSGSHILTYSFRDTATGCPNEAHKTITVYPKPTALLDSLIESCINIERVFSIKNPDLISSFKWDLGDGTKSTEDSIKHSFTKEGIYNLTLIIASRDNCTDTLKSKIVVELPPTAVIIPIDTTVCSGRSVAFKVLSSNTTKFKWTINNVEVASGIQPTPITFQNHTASDTTYKVVVSLGGHACPNSSQIFSVKTYPQVKAAININKDKACNNEAVILKSDRSFGHLRSWMWDFNNGKTFNQANPPIQFFKADSNLTVYKIRLIVDDSLCGSDTTFQNLEVKPIFTRAFINVAESKVCENAPLRFVNLSAQFDNIIWDFNDHSVQQSDSIVNHIFKKAGVYTVGLKAFNNCGGFDADSIKITVLPSPKIDSLTYKIADKCQETTVQFKGYVTATSPITFKWLFSNKDSSLSEMPIITFKNGGTYSAIYSATFASNLCTASDSIKINLIEPLKLAIDTVYADRCGLSNGSIFLKEIGGAAPFQYAINDTSHWGNKRVFDSLLGQKSYAVFVKDMKGCFSKNQVRVEGRTPLSVSLGGDLTIDMCDSLKIKAAVNVPNTMVQKVNWSPQVNCLSTDCLSILMRPAKTTLYTVHVTDTLGCIETDKVLVFVNEKYAFYDPNVFSPNGDGHDDIFYLQGNDCAIAKIKQFRIITEWGNLVYERFDVPINQAEFGWNGKFGDIDMGAGVYKWFAELELFNGSTVYKKGNVTLQK